MKPIIPDKLRPGDEIRVITPSRSFAIISKDQREISLERFAKLGLKITFGKHVEECDEFNSSSIESRIEDLHAAFSDPNVKGVLTVIGGFNSNQLLKYINFDLIKSHPKILCGYSDITALQNSIFAKTGLVTYSGPHFSTFAMKQRFDFTLEHFKKCLFEDAPFDLRPSECWSDDAWFADQDKRDFIKNEGYKVINEGTAEGTIIGGNLCTFNLLQGTEFMTSLQDTVLFLEDDEALGSMTDVEFERNLQSILHLPDFSGVRALVIGRFQKKSEMTISKIQKIISTKRELRQIPVIYGVDFGHTDPYITFPVGGRARVEARGDKAKIEILSH